MRHALRPDDQPAGAELGRLAADAGEAAALDAGDERVVLPRVLVDRPVLGEAQQREPERLVVPVDDPPLDVEAALVGERLPVGAPPVPQFQTLTSR
jgi:hypothetical protein